MRPPYSGGPNLRHPDQVRDEVWKSLSQLVPFLPRVLGWVDGAGAPRNHRLHRESTGGPAVYMKRNVEVQPFAIDILLHQSDYQRPPTPELPLQQNDYGLSGEDIVF